MAEVGCGLWLGLVFGSLVVVWSGVWVVAEVGCWSSEIASVWVRRGHGEIDVGHDDGFGGDWRGSRHGWLVLLGFRWVFIYFYFINMGFCSGGILVSSGQWWLGFFWVFVPMGFCSTGFFWVDDRRFLGIFDSWVFLG